MSRKFRTEPEVKKFVATPGEASDDFWRAFCSMGSIVADCLCGRTHFADSDLAGDWEDGELDRLRQNAAEKPDRYIGHDYDAVSISAIGIIGDCPCGMSAKYEAFLETYRREIISYLVATARKAKDEAKAEIDEADRELRLLDEAAI